MPNQIFVGQRRLEDDFIPFAHRFERVANLLLKVATKCSNVDDGCVSGLECLQEFGFVGVSLGLNQFGLVVIFGSWEWGVKINQIQGREMLALQVVDQV